jgi:transposase-like protein
MADATLESRVPQDRMGRFSTELFERYQRSEKAGHIDTSLRRAVPLR